MASQRIAEWFDYVRSPAATECDENLLYLDPDGYIEGARWASTLRAFDQLVSLRKQRNAPVSILILFPLTPVTTLGHQAVAAHEVELHADPRSPAVVCVTATGSEPPEPLREEHNAPAGWSVATAVGHLPVQVWLYRSEWEQADHDPYRRSLMFTG